MPNCTIIFRRDSGSGRNGPTLSKFAANKLVPLLEGRMSNGSSLHVIHDRIPARPIEDKMKRHFDELIKDRRFMRDWKNADRDWREGAKRQFSAADSGSDSMILNRATSPEATVILEANKENPGMVRNHLGFYTMEAAIEKTRYILHLEFAEEKARGGDIPGAVNHLMEAQNALAECNLLRDLELMNQIQYLSGDVVLFRGLNGLYLTYLEGKDMPVVLDRSTVVDFAEIVRRRVSLSPERSRMSD
jgi:hypothetical protein